MFEIQGPEATRLPNKILIGVVITDRAQDQASSKHRCVHVGCVSEAVPRNSGTTVK